MDNNFMIISPVMMSKLAVSEIIKCNEITSQYGVILSPKEALELVETRSVSLSGNGRIEFAGGIINKMILKFCSSPFLSQFNYATTLNELIETFYYFKNETLDELSDDELISLMKKYFDHNCQGCMELLQNRELETLARNIRYSICDYADVSEDTKEAYDEYYYGEEESLDD